ncbi:MAG: tetraacyldisaccharide 4'-kinase [Holosporaceae bacterium]|jgi:tetraacyldisaccharide 4'-kinase|nr:tetraacyldisaccharide 4'-kinase [Holosporaceae bacterium]
MFFIKAPKFWYKHPNIFLKYLLKPISCIYSIIAANNYKKAYKYKSVKSKIIAIGGMTTGGSGKTIVVKSICDILRSQNKKTAILSRGYGRSSNEILAVNNAVHSYNDVGDEPLLLSKDFPVFVGQDRSKIAKLAEQDDFDYLVLDDGVMQRSLEPDVRILVIDDEQGIGNGETLPLGPNRIDFKIIKPDIDFVVILGYKKSFDVNKFKMFADIPIVYGQLRQDFSNMKNRRILAFCGLGYPNKFFKSLKSYEVVKEIAFPDHYPYSEGDILKLISDAQKLRAQLVTTEKDLIRIPKKYHKHIETISINVVWRSKNCFMF